MSCESRKDKTDKTVLELRGRDCLSQLVAPICLCCYSSVIIELEFGILYIVIAHVHCTQ